MARRVEAQMAQLAIFKHFSETKDFNEINPRKRVQRQIKVQGTTVRTDQITCETKYGYCDCNHAPRRYPME